MEWDWDFSFKIIPQLAEGVIITIRATVLGSILAMILGLVLAILRRSKTMFLNKIVGFFIEFIRGTPLLVQLYFLFYILPGVFPVEAYWTKV